MKKKVDALVNGTHRKTYAPHRDNMVMNWSTKKMAWRSFLVITRAFTISRGFFI